MSVERGKNQGRKLVPRVSYQGNKPVPFEEYIPLGGTLCLKADGDHNPYQQLLTIWWVPQDNVDSGLGGTWC